MDVTHARPRQRPVEHASGEFTHGRAARHGPLRGPCSVTTGQLRHLRRQIADVDLRLLALDAQVNLEALVKTSTAIA
jgi:hypothetical protein